MSHPVVLYVEDEEADVFFVQRAFEFLRATSPLRVIRNGRDAVDYLAGNGRFSDRQRYPLPSLVLLDLHLPAVSGMEVLEWIRQQPQFQLLPVVIFSGSSLENDQQQALQRGANDFIVKPLNMSRVQDVLRSVLDRWLKDNSTGEQAA